MSPNDFAVVSPTVFQAGDVINAIAQTARIGVNVRTKRESDRERILSRIEALAKGAAEANGGSARIEWLRGCPATPQDPAMVERALRVARSILPEGKAVAGSGMNASEDYAWLAREAPSVHVILGGGSAAEGYPHTNHHPAYRFDERCLLTGARFEAAMAMDLLMNP